MAIKNAGRNRRRRWAGLLLLAAALLLAACGGRGAGGGDSTSKRTPSRSQAASSPVDAVKLSVTQPGLVRVAEEDLEAVGFDPRRHDPGRLVLSLAGEPVTLLAETVDGQLDLTFYGTPRDSRYARANVYRLRWGEPAGEQSQRAVLPAQGQPQTTFTAQHRLEEAHHYLSQIPAGGDHWLWKSLFAPDTMAVDFELPGWSGGDTLLAVSLWANTEDTLNPDHRAILRVNDQPVAESAWDGQGWHTITATVPANILQPAGNRLVLEAPGDTGATVDVVYLDRIDLDYSREMKADGGRLALSAPAGATVAVTGLEAGQALLWDVTDPLAAQPLSGAVAANGGLSFQDSSATGLRRYVVAERSARLSPASIQPDDAIDLRQNPVGADYIAIAHPDFLTALQPLIDYRRSQGLRVTAVSVEDVYDTFSDGMIDPVAIRDFMAYARDHWPSPAPRFLLLVGDASYDYLGFLEGSTPNYVPTYLMQTHFVGETASDNWFVSLDDQDDRPDMAVGRIPAQTAQQVADVVAKTLAYEQDPQAAEWAGRALFVADDKQSNFQEISDELAASFLPGSYQVEKIYLGKADDPAAALIQQLNQGVGLVTYVGHGSMNVWAQEKILRTEDANGLKNTALPFMMTMTCLVGYFHHPQITSMGEALLFNPAGGVVAALVPTSESLASDQSQLASNILTHMFDGSSTVGEAIMRAKQDLPAERDLMQDLIETFVLLGDPALRLQQPG